MNRFGNVYKITSPTGRIYIGSSSNIKKRFVDYKCYDCKYQRKLYNSLKKYGWENHIFEIIWKGKIDEMLKQEVIFGLQFNVLSENNLNCKLPKIEDIFTCISEETRLKMRAAHKKRFEIMSDEKRNLLGKKRIGQKQSKEAINQRSKIVRKPVIQLDTNNNFIKQWESASNAGKILNISQSDITQCCKQNKKSCGGFKWEYLNKDFINRTYKTKKEHHNKNKKTVIQMDLNNNYIKEWSSIAEAKKELNILSSHISSCCNGKRNIANGFKWKYKNEIILIK